MKIRWLVTGYNTKYGSVWKDKEQEVPDEEAESLQKEKLCEIIQEKKKKKTTEEVTT